MGDNLPYVILDSGEKPLKVYAGGYRTCMVLDNNDIKCFGQNTAGQHAHGHSYNIGTDVLSMGANLPATH